MKNRPLLLALLTVLALTSGCANVQPWQRGTLADFSMRPDRNTANDILNEHVWFSREGATGGRGLSAGGCGCN